MMTTNNPEGADEQFPRIQTAKGLRPNRMSYGTMYSGHGTNSSGGFNTVGGGRGMSAQPQYRMPIIRQAENLDENRVVLYKQSKQLG